MLIASALLFLIASRVTGSLEARTDPGTETIASDCHNVSKLNLIVCDDTFNIILSYLDADSDDILNLTHTSKQTRSNVLKYFFEKSTDRSNQIITEQTLIRESQLNSRCIRSLICAHSNLLNWAVESRQNRLARFLISNCPKRLRDLEYAFFIAILNRNFEMSDYLLANDVDIHAQQDFAIRAVLETGNIGALVYLTDEGAFATFDKTEAMKVAVKKGHIRLVQHLCAEYAEIIDFDASLAVAAELGYMNIVIFLLRLKRHKSNSRAAVSAALHGHADVLKYLFDNGFDITENVLVNASYVIVGSNHHQVLELIFERVPATKHRLQYLLNAATINNHFETVKILIENGAQVSAEYLYNALINRNREMIEYLIEYGATIGTSVDWKRLIFADEHIVNLVKLKGLAEESFFDLSNEQTLSIVARRGDLESVQRLVLEGNVDINYGDNFSLQQATEFNHFEVVKFLVDKGANIHADRDYVVFLSSAIGNYEMLKFFVDRGADPRSRAKFSFRRAVDHGFLDIVTFLMESTEPESLNLTEAFSVAIKHGYFDVVKLIFKVAEENSQPLYFGVEQNNFPLRLAVKYGHFNIIRFLIENNFGTTLDISSAMLWGAGSGHLNEIIESIQTSENETASSDRTNVTLT